MAAYIATSSMPQNGRTLNGGDTLEAQNGGVATDTLINSGGVQQIDPGGTALNSLVNGGIDVIYGSDSGTRVASGSENVYFGGKTTGSSVTGGTQSVFGAAFNVSVSGGTQNIYGTADGTALSGGAMLVGGSGGAATNTFISGTGTQTVDGTATTTTINAGGTQVVDSGGAANTTTVNANGAQNVLAGGAATGTVLNGALLQSGVQSVAGTATSTTINANGVQVIYAGGTSINAVVNADGGQIVYGNATGTTVNAGGVERVQSGGTATNTVIAGGTLDLLDGAAAAGNITFSGAGTLKIERAVPATTNFVFTAAIAGFGAGDILDLSGLGFVAGSTTASLSGSTLTVSDGSASETLTLSAATVGNFALADDGAGGVLVTGVAPPPPLSVAFDGTTGGFVNGRTPIFTGSIANATGTATVEIYDGDPANGGKDLGAATVNGNGFTFRTRLGAGDRSSFYAVARDSSGASATALAPYELVTGVQGEAYKAIEYDYTPDGSYAYSEYDRKGRLLVAAVDTGNNTHAIEGNGQSGLTFYSIANDKIHAYGQNENFVFVPGFAKDVVQDFIVAGNGHDTLDLSNTSLGGLADMLRHTTSSGGTAVIHTGEGDQIRLAGVTKAELKANPGDFFFG